MPYQIGVDEAGYGPNLGPLVITATVWHVPGDPRRVDLSRRLNGIVTNDVAASATRGGLPVTIADSKILYQPQRGLGLLERGVLAALRLLGVTPRTWDELWQALDPTAASDRDAQPWFDGYETTLPLAIETNHLDGVVPALEAGFARASVRLAAVHSRAVFPARFNELVAQHGSKGAALSLLTVQLVADVLADYSDEPVFMVCDKHGGRNYYHRFLQGILTESLVEVYREGRRTSTYRWGTDKNRVEINFRAQGESFLPTALASMVSKYLREVAMRAFNDFWCGRMPELRPTAGYPMDSLRFKTAIAPLQQALGIDDRLLWRVR